MAQTAMPTESCGAFRDIAFLNRLQSTGPDRWFPIRNMNYNVAIYGNQFSYSGADGQIAGTFMGERHEGMAGTLKRTDLIGAFGGTR